MKVARGRPLRRGIVRWGLVSSVQLGTSMALGCGPGAPVETGAETRGTGEPTTSGATAGTTELDATATSTTSGGDDSGVAPPWLDFPADCSMFEQDCPPGYKCVPFDNDGGVAFNDTKCSPLVDDPAGPGEACHWIRGNTADGIDDCNATSFCWFFDPRSGEGTCVEMCSGTSTDPTCTQACDWCDSFADQVINLCTFLCDPVAQNCPPGEACVFDAFAYSCQPDVAPGTTVGGPCDGLDCAAGMVCLPWDQTASCATSYCCTPFCSMDGPDLCPTLLPGTVCTQVQDPQWLPSGCGAETAGLCLLPPA